MIKPLIRGLQLTFRTLFTRPVTFRYPEERMTMFPRFRGLHELKRSEAGEALCVACGLCAAACPAGCLRVEAAESAEHRRYPALYEIDLARCIFCGFCAEACPYGALILRESYETAAYAREDLVLDRDRLLRTYQGRGGPRR